MNLWQMILVTLGGSGMLLAAVAWLVKKIATHFLDKDVEAYKIRLQADADKQLVSLKVEADRQLESLKSELRMTAFEHEVRFSKLHEKRAEIIAAIYERLIAAQYAAETYLREPDSEANADSKEDRFISAMRKLRELCQYVDSHRIYLEENMCQQIDVFRDKLVELTFPLDLLFTAIRQKDNSVPEDEARQILIDLFKDNAVPIRKALQDEFRRILGVAKQPDQIWSGSHMGG